MNTRLAALAMSFALGATLFACDGSDPTGESEGLADARFDIQATRVETFEEVEVLVQVNQRGTPLQMQHGELGLRNGDGPVRYMDMERDRDGFRARLMFFEPGTHRLDFRGQRHGHHEMHQYGYHEFQVHRRHHVIGSYWVELDVDPRPLLENQTATITLLAFELIEDNRPGEPAGGLEVAMTVRDPADAESPLDVAEAATGEYAASYSFGAVGVYDLPVQIGSGDSAATGEFHIPVFTSLEDAVCHHDRDCCHRDG